ncbi:MAG: low temperature requirement protein A [Lapillicoccus sp.]
MARAGPSLVVFVLVYWIWVGAATQGNEFDMDQARRRLALFAIGLCGLVMALSVTEAYADRGLAFALAYWAARVILVVGLLDRRRFVFMPYTVSAFVTGPVLVAGALLPATPRLAVWAAAAALDLAMPTLRRRSLNALHFDADHLTERYGLFVLIALGESIVAIGVPVASATTWRGSTCSRSGSRSASSWACGGSTSISRRWRTRSSRWAS